MFERWYALDAGAYQMRLYNFSNEKEITMRTCLAYKGKDLLAMSHDALEYVYHRDSTTHVKYPISEGRILSDVSKLIEKGLEDAGNTNRFYRPCLLICLPSRNPDIENEWVVNLSQTGIKKFEFVTNSEILEYNKYHFYIHAGHSYTQIGFVVDGQEKFTKMILFGGIQIDEMIQKIVAQKTQCLISNEDACILKEAASNQLKQRKNAVLSCFAMNRYQKYVKIEVSSMDLWPALENIEKQIVLWTKECISKLGLELQGRVFENGIYLSGGLASCFGLKQYLEHELRCPIIITEQPSFDVIDQMKGWK